MVIYFAVRRWDFALSGNDMTPRLTLILATLSTIGLIVLGATSVDAAIRYMGVKNWQRLHTTNYVISALAILHVVLDCERTDDIVRGVQPLPVFRSHVQIGRAHV